MSYDPMQALGELVERWALVASQVESGYVLSFDDYLNDIDLRRIIDEQLRAPEDAKQDSVPESVRAMLSSADAQFRDATDEVEKNIWGEAAELDEGWSAAREWYYYRLPKSRPDWL